MKVIDLLNKIAKGEEVPKKFKIDNNIYVYNKKEGEVYVNNLYHIEDNENITFNFQFIPSYNYEVEIIEEDKKIEYLSYEETTLWADDEDGKIPLETIVKFDNKELVNKIKEIIDEVNKLKDDRK